MISNDSLENTDRIPLHVACANTSGCSHHVVALLLEAYPQGAQQCDDEDNLPLHVCLSNAGQSDSVYEIVNLLLNAYPAAARIPTGKTRKLAPAFREFPVELILASRTQSSPAIVCRLLSEYPEIVFKRDRMRATIFHKLCWNRMLQRQAHSQREATESDDIMTSVRIFDAISLIAKVFNPDLIQWSDSNEALPLHYASQVMALHSREMLQRLLRYSPNAAFAQDKFGNTPLHLVLTSESSNVLHKSLEDNTYDLGRVLAQESSAALMIPNKDHKLPVHMVGAWRLRGIFITNDILSKIMLVIPLALEGVLLVAVAHIAAESYVKTDSIVVAVCCGVILLLRSLLFSTQQWKKPVRVYKGLKSRVLNLLIIWLQAFHPTLSILRVFGMCDEQTFASLLWMRRMQMPLLIFPMGILCALDGVSSAEGLASLHTAGLASSIVILSILGAEQDYYRVGRDTRKPWVRPSEILLAVLFRGLEACQRMTLFASVTIAFGGGGLCLSLLFEVLLSMTLSGQLYLFIMVPLSNLSLLRREIFDLCGIYHGYGLLQSGGSEKLATWDNVGKTVPVLLYDCAYECRALPQVFDKKRNMRSSVPPRSPTRFAR